MNNVCNKKMEGITIELLTHTHMIEEDEKIESDDKRPS
jgi:hypothetical protein